MSTVQKYLIKAGATIAFASMIAFGATNEASAEEMSASNWQPRTVSEISSQIEEQMANQDGEEAIEYTFQWGDTLWGISEATDVSVDKLVKVNDIDNRSMIQVDTKIYLSGDSSIISVQNDDEVVSYDVSEDEVVETETPDEVKEEVAKEEKPEAVQETKPEVEEAPAEEATVPEVSTSSSDEATQASQSGRTVAVEATAYSLNQPELGNVTFSGIDLRETPNVIAVDPSVIPLGSRVNIPGYGEFIAGDTGSAIQGNRIDIHMTDLQQALQFGRRSIEVQIIE
ncbi:3D domain-containing protein [Marinilactibacillus kalidii]|uniref:3D domain-containing protein n=1 Tax=Marinilactibacillus kalidii TaxID=2820274 RepID=UPI001ABDBAC7|nr:3D domain-containing protein [Marinilactibacillus kalidii]